MPKTKLKVQSKNAGYLGCPTYTKGINRIAVSMHHLEQFSARESTISISVILGKHVLKLLGPKSPLAVICPAVGSVLKMCPTLSVLVKKRGQGFDLMALTPPASSRLWQ